MAEDQRIVFMGTPAFGAIILENLVDANMNLAGVYTQPDRPAGRGLRSHESEVKKIAKKAAIPVFQPANLRSAEAVAQLRQLEPDFLVVAAYGLILSQEVLDIPRIAPINVHASLLPKYRGAAPIQRAIQDNWQPGAKTGVSIMRIVRELDAGPVYEQAGVCIDHKDSHTLAYDLAKAGSRLLLQILPEIATDAIRAIPQNNDLATYAPKLTKTDGIIDWHRSAFEVDALIRAMNPWPGGQTQLGLNGKIWPVLIRSGSIGPECTDYAPGQILCLKEGLSIACSDNWYRIEKLQPHGRKEMGSREFANGQRLQEGIVGKVA